MIRVLFLLALTGCNAVPTVDHGGIVDDYLSTTNKSLSSAISPIEAVCESACNIKLSGNYCVQRHGVFGVHATKYIMDGSIVPIYANAVRNSVPACFRNLADRKDAWRTFNMTNIPAWEVIQACPSITICP